MKFYTALGLLKGAHFAMLINESGSIKKIVF